MNENITALKAGAILKAGQKVVFDLEVIYRDNWSNGNGPYCQVIELRTNKVIT